MKIITLVAFTILTVSMSFGQTLSSPTELVVMQQPTQEVVIDEADLDNLDNAFDLLDANASMELVVSMVLSDTLNVATIHVKVGTTSGGNDFGEYAFSYDGGGDATHSYFREDLSLVLGMGAHTLTDQVFCEIYTEDASGNTSPVVSYSN